jgi:hypothetical protein
VVARAEGALKEGAQALSAKGLRLANARDFAGQSFSIQDVAGADSVVLPEIGVALIASAPFAARWARWPMMCRRRISSQQIYK